MKKLIKILLIFLYFIPLASAVPLTNFDFTIYDNNEVIFEGAKVYDSTYGRYQYGNPNYVLEVKNKEGYIVEQTRLPISFYHPAVGSVDQTYISISLPYNPNWKGMQIYHSGKLIFQKDIENYFCNDNNLCEENENYVSCKKDCPSGSKDRWCDGLADNVCDSDCLEGIDPDCGQVKEFLKKNVLWQYFIIIILSIVIILVIRKIKKKHLKI